MEINITVIDRDGQEHPLQAPTDMAMNLMEICKAYELPVEGTCGGMAMCASCQCYVLSQHPLQEKSPDEDSFDLIPQQNNHNSKPDLNQLIFEQQQYKYYFFRIDL